MFQLCPGEHESLRDGLDFGESCVPIPFIRLALGLDYTQCVYPYTYTLCIPSIPALGSWTQEVYHKFKASLGCLIRLLTQTTTTTTSKTKITTTTAITTQLLS